MAAPIYLDNHATTRVDERVLAAMLPYFSEKYGNAASVTHAYGWTAEAAVDLAREQVAALIGANANEITLTSGATEANNLALQGVARAYRRRGRHLVTARTEHPSVLEPLEHLAAGGAEVTVLPVSSDGLVSVDAVVSALREDTVLVSVMLVNNEIGVVQPVADIARAVKEAAPKVVVHCDAVQAAGRLPIDVGAMPVDLLSLSAHKMYGPKGVGCLWRRRRPRVAVEPLCFGGGHERGLRPGTLPVPLIVGFGAAAEIAQREGPAETERIRGLRDRLLGRLESELDGVCVNGSLIHRVAGNLNVSFAGVSGEALVMAVRDVAMSTGSACSSASARPSHVIEALGDASLAESAIRFGIGRFNTEDEIDRAAESVTEAVRRLRPQSAS